jgi:hypothetical protein
VEQILVIKFFIIEKKHQCIFTSIYSRKFLKIEGILMNMFQDIFMKMTEKITLLFKLIHSLSYITS